MKFSEKCINKGNEKIPKKFLMNIVCITCENVE